MVKVTKTAAQARAEAKVDWAKAWAKVDATKEDIRRLAVEDGQYPDDDSPNFEPPESIRRRLGMTQEAFAAALHIPVATIRNWEQKRVWPDLAALALLRIVAREPKAALRALAA